MVQCRKKSSHDCRSDRLTVSTVAATVTVTAAVTVSVTAAVAATAMSTQIYREKQMIGAAATSPPTAGGGTCLNCATTFDAREMKQSIYE